MNKAEKYRKILLSIYRYFIFFLLMSFVITCSMLLFINTMSNAMGITLTQENIGDAAKLTFANVVVLSLVCTVIDGIRRRYMVKLPSKRITEAAQKIANGDFSVRIKRTRGLNRNDEFNEIIDCFNKVAEELSGIETLRTDFISNVSHELKTPLAVMQNYGTMLASDNLSDEKRIEYAKAITTQSQKLAELISNILKLNKLENQQIFHESETYDLGEQLCECLLNFENIWEEKQLTIETEIEDNIFVTADKQMMTLVWNNLFSNAIKFTDKGTITLKLSAHKEFATVTISDTGCGISSDVGMHIFDKFYQGDTSHSSQGNGLGLALVKRIIDITGSDISVESQLGKGSTFTVKMRRDFDEEIKTIKQGDKNGKSNL